VALPDQAGEYFAAAGKASPPVAIIGITEAGVTLQDWVLIATLLYTLLQISLLAWKTYKNWNKPNDGG
jgi:hypothetical protein